MLCNDVLLFRKVVNDISYKDLYRDHAFLNPSSETFENFEYWIYFKFSVFDWLIGLNGM